MTLMILTGLTACDYAAKQDLKNEREDAAYRAAMSDYNAGRIQQAIDGFRKVCRKDPANASARFQLACLLQDSERDCFEALCLFREYLFQHPESDKSRLAKERAARCEKIYEKTVLARQKGSGETTIAAELEETREMLKKAKERSAKLDNDFAEAMRRIATLRKENERLMRLIKSEGSGEDSPAADADSGLKDAKALLDSEEPDRVTQSTDIATLRLEEKAERELETTLLPRQPTDAKAKRDAAERAENEDRRKAADSAPKIPETYEVQEGDTLYKIATRFYGTFSAWKRIRDLNKAIISVDGKVRAGQILKLPPIQ